MHLVPKLGVEILKLLMNFCTLNESLEADALVSGCPYAISNSDGGKYPKQFQRGLTDGSVDNFVVVMLYVN